MRAAFVVLIVLNLFLALGLVLQDRTPKKAAVDNDNSIQVLPLSKYVEPPKRCVELGPFSAHEVDAVRRMLEDLALAQQLSSVENAVTAQWWVYIPSRPSHAEALRRARELEKLGVGELHVFDEASPWKYAISLGLFRSEAAAQAHLAFLQRKGVRGVKLEQQEHRLTQTVFYATDPDSETIGRLTQVKAQFGHAELRQLPCSGLRRN